MAKKVSCPKCASQSVTDRGAGNALPRYRLTVSTSLGSALDADTLAMDVRMIEFNPELQKTTANFHAMKDALLSLPGGCKFAQLESKNEMQAKVRRDFLQSMLNQYHATSAAPTGAAGTVGAINAEIAASPWMKWAVCAGCNLLVLAMLVLFL